MGTAGYSGTPLDRKLGVAPGHRVLLLGAPDQFVGGTLVLPDGAQLVGGGPFDVAVLFATERAALERELARLLPSMPSGAALWVAWPKRAAKVPTDITEDVVREVALPTGLVDNKVCAIDELWSGLRLVVRKEHRAGWPVRRDH